MVTFEKGENYSIWWEITQFDMRKHYSHSTLYVGYGYDFIYVYAQNVAH